MWARDKERSSLGLADERRRGDPNWRQLLDPSLCLSMACRSRSQGTIMTRILYVTVAFA